MRGRLSASIPGLQRSLLKQKTVSHFYGSFTATIHSFILTVDQLFFLKLISIFKSCRSTVRKDESREMLLESLSGSIHTSS